MLHRGRRFCCRRLLPGAVTSEAAARVMSFFSYAATLVSQTTPLNIDWGCGLRTTMNMRMRVRVSVRNRCKYYYCSCVLNKIMPPKGGSERSELTPCIYIYS